MGLCVSTMRELPTGDRSLYIYLLDYGWPTGPYERIFRDNFGALSRRASDTGSVVVMSDRGVDFANEVLSWHSILGFDAAELLPAILITRTHPKYFESERALPNDAHEQFRDLALIPLKRACTTPDDFLQVVSSVFVDLESGLTLKNFRVVEFDTLTEKRAPEAAGLLKRVGRAVILQPNVAGLGVDLKKLFGAEDGAHAAGR